MAIKLEYTDPVTQFTSDYWDISGLSSDQINDVTFCCLGLYASAGAEENGAKPITAINFTIPGNLDAVACLNYIIANYQQFSSGVII